MWNCEVEALNDGRVQRFVISDADQQTLTYAKVIDLWKSNAEFRTYFIGLLANCEFHAFRWETPGVSLASLDREFEFVLIQANALDRAVDELAFQEHFSNDEPIVTFPNLGRDALMIVPCPQKSAVADCSIYCHLASVIRNAPASQTQQLFQSVAEALLDRIHSRDQPVWLSTAGMGVAWLHVRLDDRPKYYGYQPYRADRVASQ